MANYSIAMGQGVSVADLGGDKLAVGGGKSGSDDSLQSCSVLFFFNSSTHAAGAYHYPAGDITKVTGPKSADAKGAQAVISAIVKEISPDFCQIYHGNDDAEKKDSSGTLTNETVRAQHLENINKLDGHVKGVMRGKTVKSGPIAAIRACTMAQTDGTPAFKMELLNAGDLTALDKKAPGDYTDFKIYSDGSEDRDNGVVPANNTGCCIIL